MKHLYYHHLKDLKDSKIILFKLCLIVILFEYQTNCLFIRLFLINFNCEIKEKRAILKYKKNKKDG